MGGEGAGSSPSGSLGACSWELLEEGTGPVCRLGGIFQVSWGDGPWGALRFQTSCDQTPPIALGADELMGRSLSGAASNGLCPQASTIGREATGGESNSSFLEGEAGCGPARVSCGPGCRGSTGLSREERDPGATPECSEWSCSQHDLRAGTLFPDAAGSILVQRGVGSPLLSPGRRPAASGSALFQPHPPPVSAALGLCMTSCKVCASVSALFMAPALSAQVTEPWGRLSLPHTTLPGDALGWSEKIPL
ncbi:hypothetical protein KIL84_021194 [Mauremys mutica]|uniref:Uncharacterized protein n=1 Tax=Mauremys mutica TaxID=74926 RepID=A0A9D4B198_9SAUR|nr:hypothetical protein KIL84_021194 [Mauremys mutica]